MRDPAGVHGSARPEHCSAGFDLARAGRRVGRTARAGQIGGPRMDDHFAPRPEARWFTAGAIASLLFMLLICAGYAIHLTTDPATLPIDERAVYQAEPVWVS